MIERFIDITNFRSIGTKETSKFELNYILKPSDKFGGLITIIGENNSGKSNYIEAIRSFGEKMFSAKDVPYTLYGEGSGPVISLLIKDIENKLDYKVKLKENKVTYTKFKDGVETKMEQTKMERNVIVFEINEVADYCLSIEFKQILETSYHLGTNIGRQNWTTYNKLIFPFFTKIKFQCAIDIDEKKSVIELLKNGFLAQNILTKFGSDNGKNVLQNTIDYLSNYTITNNTSNDVFEYIPANSNNNGTFEYRPDNSDNNEIFKEVKTKYKINLFPNIYTYIDKDNIKTDHTISPVESGVIQNLGFIEKLYGNLNGESIDSLKNVYKLFFDSGNKRKDLLTNYENKINVSIKELGKKFNQVYSFSDKEKYAFRLSLERDSIYFLISENGFDIPLDAQSTGFKWFFDFFFNIFANEEITNGDIVIMDEPATNLHPAGQIELRKQIQDFGHKSGILFILSTHSPFLIDQNYLDEIRLIKKVNQESILVNKFTVNEESSVDVLLPIKTALTVNRHILLNPDDILIFVEGITDYNYLVAFKNQLKIDRLTFVPIQGIRRPNLDKDLLKITKRPILLVDSDSEGKGVYEKYNNKQNMEIHQLKEFDSSFITIEDLFSPEDKKLYCYNLENKKDYKLSSYFKHNIGDIYKKLSKQTKDNFSKVLNDLLM